MDLERELLNLKKVGWFLSRPKVDEALERETNTTGLPKQKLVSSIGKLLLDQDLKELGEPCLPDDINSSRVPKLEGPLVLQVKKIVNVAAPQISQDSGMAPRMLKVSMTDGKTTCHGVEYQSIPKLSLKVAPGSKVLLNGTINVVHGFLLLTSSNVELLGGEVEHLAEKWRIQQSLVGHTRTAQSSGPPPWVPFGQRLNFKLPDNKTASRGSSEERENKEREENEEFNAQRHEAIVAAEHAGSRQKAFGGAAKQVGIPKPETYRREPRDRGRGQNRREDREDHTDSRPRDSINLFEFLQPQIGSEGAETALEQPTETREHHREPQRGPQRGGGRYQRPGRGARGGYQSRPGPEPSRTVQKLTEDFAAWPSLDEEPETLRKPPQQQFQQQRQQHYPRQQQDQYSRQQQQQWAPDDYCLARWESSDNYYPAVIQEFTANGAAQVLFVENGLVRNVDVRNLRLDSADSSRPSSSRNDSHPREGRGGRGGGPRGGTRVFSRRRNY